MPRFQNATAIQTAAPSANGVRGAIDALVQGSLVDLFSAYSVALAPLPRSARAALPSLSDICAGVTFTHAGRTGRIALGVPGAVLDEMARVAPGSLRADWVRELANQLTGRIKNRLLQFNVRLQLGTSIVLDPSQLTQQITGRRDCRTYAARTLRGQVVTNVDGLPDESELTYVGAVNIAAEGDAILF